MLCGPLTAYFFGTTLLLFVSPLRTGLLEVSAARKAVWTFILSSFSFLRSPKQAEIHLPWGSLVPSIMKPQRFGHSFIGLLVSHHQTGRMSLLDARAQHSGCHTAGTQPVPAK